MHWGAIAQLCSGTCHKKRQCYLVPMAYNFCDTCSLLNREAMSLLLLSLASTRACSALAGAELSPELAHEVFALGCKFLRASHEGLGVCSRKKRRGHATEHARGLVVQHVGLRSCCPVLHTTHCVSRTASRQKLRAKAPEMYTVHPLGDCLQLDGSSR